MITSNYPLWLVIVHSEESDDFEGILTHTGILENSNGIQLFGLVVDNIGNTHKVNTEDIEMQKPISSEKVDLCKLT